MIHPDSPHEVHPHLPGVGRTGPQAKWDYITGKNPSEATRFCWTRFCRGKRGSHHRVCYKCQSRLRRLNNPLACDFQILRSNAKRRGKHFDLTFEEYARFAAEHGYTERKGRTAGCLHIDRKDPLLGYTYDNLTVLESTVNSAKGAIEDKLRHYNHQPAQAPLPLDPDDVGF